MTIYEKYKDTMLAYQANSKKYAKYKKKYDNKYRKVNKEYANFRAIKSTYIKKYGEELGSIKIAAYILKKKLRGIELENLLSPTNR